MIVPVRGSTLLFRAGPGDLHLHICLTAPFDALAEPPQQVLMVSATTIYGIRGEDLTCLLKPGDHPFLVVPSYIAYSHWRCVTVSALNRAEGLGMAKAKEPMDAAVLKRIRDGLFTSQRAPRAARNFVLAYENANP